MPEPNDNVRISVMTVEDVPRVHELERLSFSSPWDINAYYGEVLNPTAYYLVARVDGNIEGFGGMWAIEDEAHIVTLAVHPDFRRRGIARRIMEGLLTEAGRRGVVDITLEVRAGNIAAQRLYTSLGFTTIAYRRHYYPDNGEDAQVMGLRLTS